MPETELETPVFEDDSDGTDETPAPVSIQTEEVSEMAPGKEDSTESSVEEKSPDNILAQARFERSQAKAERESVAREREQMNAEYAFRNQPKRPDVPQIDQYADDYAVQQGIRDTAIREAATFDANAQFGEQQLERQQQEAYFQQEQQRQKAADSFRENGIKSGISEDDMMQNGMKVANYGVLDPAEVAMIAASKQGPLITKYLADNPVEAQRLNDLPFGSIERTTMLVTDIASKAIALQTKITQTPDPLEPIQNGNGRASQADDDGFKYLD